MTTASIFKDLDETIVMLQGNDPTVFVVEEDAAICDALEFLFASVQLNVEIFSNGKEYLEKHDSNRRGCLIINIRMPYISGLELQEKLAARNNSLPIVFISEYNDIAIAVRAMKSGAFDFTTKPLHYQTLLEVVQKAIEFNLELEDATDTLMVDDLSQRFNALTPKEKEVLKFIVDGFLNKQIAHTLKKTLSTVEMHRSKIMKKLHVRSLADLIKLTLRYNNLAHQKNLIV